MSIKLKGSSDGSVSFDAPADTSPSGSDIALTLPTSAGSANQFLKNSGTAGTLEYSSMIETNSGIEISNNKGLLIDNTGGTARRVIHIDTDNNLYLNSSPQDNSIIFQSGGASEAARFDSSGRLIIGKTTTSYHLGGSVFFPDGEINITRDNGVPLFIRRNTSDGQLINFNQDGTSEGNISVSGSTVSIQGAHLSRWSQLAGGAARTEILRGSVLSNLDEMCEWTYAAQDAVLYTEEDQLPEGASVGDVKTPAVEAHTEDNEQLNRMKVSDVEGDVNVAGVFQDWDDDDDTHTNDFNCAMTGDFVIRIAQGTTVARGDLLMSAGDGTAKPQDDDIVRSKTIAKVTSTTVSTTYSDGSYCVPCVLMAC